MPDSATVADSSPIIPTDRLEEILAGLDGLETTDKRVWYAPDLIRSVLTELLTRRKSEAAAGRVATDRLYMMEAYRSMLGPTGVTVARLWADRGVRRVHHDWGPEGLALSGEERAQFLLDMEAAPRQLVEKLDT